jgi:hypothetical protein
VVLLRESETELVKWVMGRGLERRGKGKGAQGGRSAGAGNISTSI